MTCEHIESIIREVESCRPAVLKGRTKRYWVYTMDSFFRGALIYGGKRGIADAIDFANKNSGINREIDTVLHDLDLCERDSVRKLGNGTTLWVLYYCLFVARMDEAERNRYGVSLKMIVSGWIAFKLARKCVRKDV